MVGGKRMAVLAGCNYAAWGPEDELKGCINDVVSMKKLLTSEFGFEEYFIELLTDDEKNEKKMPTAANIRRALRRMIERARKGDLLFFHFSGHGTVLRQDHGAIVPCDFNPISDMDFRQLVGTTPYGATFTILADSCHSGGLIYQQKEQIGPSVPQKPQTNSCKVKFIPIDRIHNRLQQITGLFLNIEDCIRQHFGDDNVSLSFLHPHQVPAIQGFIFTANQGFNFPANQGFIFPRTFDNGILLSACQHDEKAIDDVASKPPHGKFSYAVMTALRIHGGHISNRELVIQTRILLGDSQHPCLYSHDKNADATFLLQRQPNTN